MHDPEVQKNRRAWAFIMTLSASRHKFVRFVFRQDTGTWLDCHERAFAFFGGVPKRIILDNLRSGVVKADIYDPTLNRAYADMERHYGFIADPARVRAPEHKGKVERAVPTVRKHLLAGRTFGNITEANDRALYWCREEIGIEIHGTTKKKPYESFLKEEKHLLVPLPEAPFEHPLWKECTVHPDHHIVFDKSYYSLPTRYIGKKVWVKGTMKTVEVFLDHERIKTHPRAHGPGQWVTDRSDYPPDKLAFLMATPTWCRKKASEFGPATEALVTAILLLPVTSWAMAERDLYRRPSNSKPLSRTLTTTSRPWNSRASRVPGSGSLGSCDGDMRLVAVLALTSAEPEATGSRGDRVLRSASLASSSALRRARSERSPSARAWIRQAIRLRRNSLW